MNSQPLPRTAHCDDGLSWIIRGLCVFLFLLIGAYVYLSPFAPADDALRHVAKVFSGKDWVDLLVLRENSRFVGFDSHPGWHAFLGACHQVLGWDEGALIKLSVLVLFFPCVLLPLFFIRRSEVWVLSLACVASLGLSWFPRLFFGRPLLLTLAVSLFLILYWDRIRLRRLTVGDFVFIAFAVGIAVYCHSTWYLFAIPVLAMWIQGPWSRAGLVSIGVGAGFAMGALATGHPWQYLSDQLRHLYWSLLESGSQSGLAGEMRPFQGSHLPALFGLVVFLVALWRERAHPLPVLRQPALVIFILGWILSFFSARFWLDWGAPFLVLWLTQTWVVWLQGGLWRKPIVRLCLFGIGSSILLGLVFYQYSAFFKMNTPRDLERSLVQDPHAVRWLPGPEGIVYATDMRFFFNFFYLFPTEDWRYAPGFEPGMMPPPDADVYRRWRADRDVDALNDWSAQLRPQDRICLIERPSFIPPEIGVEWHFWAPYYWIGKRTPRF